MRQQTAKALRIAPQSASLYDAPFRKNLKYNFHINWFCTIIIFNGSILVSWLYYLNNSEEQLPVVLHPVLIWDLAHGSCVLFPVVFHTWHPHDCHTPGNHYWQCPASFGHVKQNNNFCHSLHLFLEVWLCLQVKLICNILYYIIYYNILTLFQFNLYD